MEIKFFSLNYYSLPSSHPFPSLPFPLQACVHTDTLTSAQHFPTRLIFLCLNIKSCYLKHENLRRKNCFFSFSHFSEKKKTICLNYRICKFSSSFEQISIVVTPKNPAFHKSTASFQRGCLSFSSYKIISFTKHYFVGNFRLKIFDNIDKL